MGDIEKGTDRSIPSHEHNIGCLRVFEKLKQTGSIRDYVKEFSLLIFDIKDMSKVNKLFNFMSGL